MYKRGKTPPLYSIFSLHTGNIISTDVARRCSSLAMSCWSLFGKNQRVSYQDEIKGAYFNSAQMTIHPVVALLLEVPSLLTKTNLAGTITYQITVIYTSTIQVELMSGNPQFAGWAFNIAQQDYQQSEANTQLCQGPVGLKNYVFNTDRNATNDCVTR